MGAMAGPIVRWGAALGFGAVWWWAVLRLLSGQAGVLEGAVTAGGWGLSLLPVHCVPKERPGERHRERLKKRTRGRTGSQEELDGSDDEADEESVEGPPVEGPGTGVDAGHEASALADGGGVPFPASGGWPYGAFGGSPSADGKWPFGTATASPSDRSEEEPGPS